MENKINCAVINYETGDYDVVWDKETKEVFLKRTYKPDGEKINPVVGYSFEEEPIGTSNGVLDAIICGVNKLKTFEI